MFILNSQLHRDSSEMSGETQKSEKVCTRLHVLNFQKQYKKATERRVANLSIAPINVSRV